MRIHDFRKTSKFSVKTITQRECKTFALPRGCKTFALPREQKYCRTEFYVKLTEKVLQYFCSLGVAKLLQPLGSAKVLHSRYVIVLTENLLVLRKTWIRYRNFFLDSYLVNYIAIMIAKFVLFNKSHSYFSLFVHCHT